MSPTEEEEALENWCDQAHRLLNVFALGLKKNS